MTPAAAKLLMCVCAGSTGAMVVPAAHKARAVMARHSVPHAAVRAAAAPVAMAAAPCLQIAGAAPALTPIAAMPAETGSADLAQLAGASANGFAGSGGGLGTGSIDGDGVGAGSIISPPPVITPVSGTVPEPANWAMMIGGFGTLGTAMRWQRRAAV